MGHKNLMCIIYLFLFFHLKIILINYLYLQDPVFFLILKNTHKIIIIVNYLYPIQQFLYRHISISYYSQIKKITKKLY